MALGTVQSFTGGASYTTAPTYKYTIPVTSGLIGYGVLPIVDLNGNVITGTANLAKRLTANFAPSSSSAAAVGSPVQSNIWTSFTHTNYLNTLLNETTGFSLMTLARSTATQTGTDVFPLMGNFVNATSSSIQSWYSTTTAARTQVSLLTPVAVFTGSITGGTLTVNTVTSGTIAIGQHLTGTGIVNDMTITAGSGSSWTVSNATVTVASTTITSGTIQNVALALTIPDVTSWRCICARYNPGVGLYLDDVTSGASASITTGTGLLGRLAPSPLALTAFGNSGTSFQGAGDAIAWGSWNRYLTNTEMGLCATQMRAYGSNRGLVT